jgi:hypothetical protein
MDGEILNIVRRKIADDGRSVGTTQTAIIPALAQNIKEGTS